MSRIIRSRKALLIAVAMVLGLGWKNIREWLPKYLKEDHGITLGQVHTIAQDPDGYFNSFFQRREPDNEHGQRG